MTHYAIGIDTGGTYTDAAIIDLRQRRVLATAKALTTRGDLALGVTKALGDVLALSGDAAATAAATDYVALSTTLATNALVEGHGSVVGVVLVGFDAAMLARTGIAGALPDARILRAGGGHDHEGAQATPLDEAAIAAFLDETSAAVGAYAIAAQWSVRNPAHEQRVREMVAARTGKPASLSSELAQALDAPRRALTAALNARIIGRISELIAAVRTGMAAHGLAARLLVVKGDGTLAPAEQMVLRPIETVLSGPAASTIGAKFLAGIDNLVVADIGGTTTDIATLEDGWPRLDPHGAMVGGHRTMVAAIMVQSWGIGGDSEVALDAAGHVTLRPRRVVPLALLGAWFPSVIASLRQSLANPEGEPYAGRYALRIPGPPPPLPPREAEMLAQIASTPTKLASFLRGPLARRALDRLVALGLVTLAGFTPSDAAHVLDRQGQWSREAAVLGALLLQRSTRMLRAGDEEAQARAFAAEVFDATVAQSGRVLLASLSEATLDGAGALVEAAVRGEGRHGRLAVRLAPIWPVVAVGGAAAVFYPELGRRLGCEVMIPEHFHVANAVGAAVAVMRARAVVEVTAIGFGGWLVHHHGAPIARPSAAGALDLARELAGNAARAAAAQAGLADSSVALHVTRVDLPGGIGDAGLIAATVIAECTAAAAPVIG